MTIRSSGHEAAKAALHFHERLGLINHTEYGSMQPVKSLYQALELNMLNLKRALHEDSERGVMQSLLSVPGTGRDLDGIDFRIEYYPELKGDYDNLIAKNALFFRELFPNIEIDVEDEDDNQTPA